MLRRIMLLVVSFSLILGSFAYAGTDAARVTGDFRISGTGSGLVFPDGSMQYTAAAGQVTLASICSAISAGGYEPPYFCVSPTEPPGKISVTVKDAVLDVGLAGVNVAVTSGGLPVASGVTGTDGNALLSVNAGSGYVVTFTKTGYQTNNYYNIAVVSGSTKFLASVLQIDNQHTGNGVVAGKIINAMTGVNISGAVINLYSGINVSGGTPVATGTTDISGNYTISNVPAGNYSAEVSALGYSTGNFTVTSIGGITRSNQNYTLTPSVPPGQTRIILTWGATPSDLDSHLTGPNGASRFHVYYSATTATGANLDRDDTSSYGPETTTITSQVDGVYRYSVHDYSNRGSSTSTALGGSSAKVQVLRGDTLVAEFNAPGSQAGTLWTVFEMNGDVITPINTMTFNTSSGSTVAKTVAGAAVKLPDTDGDLMINLPSK